MDALQQSDEQKQKAEAPDKPPPPTETPVSQVMPAVNFFGATAEPPAASAPPPPRPKGKLQIPLTKPPVVPSSTSASSNDTKTLTASKPQHNATVGGANPTQPSAEIVPEKKEDSTKGRFAPTNDSRQDDDDNNNNGWDDDLGFEEEEDDDDADVGPAPAPSVVQEEKPKPETPPKQPQSETSIVPATEETCSMAVPEVEKKVLNDPNPKGNEPIVVQKDNVSAPKEEVAADKDTNDPPTETEEETPQEEKVTVVAALETEPASEPALEATQLEEPEQTKMTPLAVSNSDEDDESDEEGPQPLPQPTAVATHYPQANGDHVEEQTKAVTVSKETTKQAEPTKKLLILCSIESLNRQATKRQENSFTILKARRLAYEVVDATDPVNHTWREELFELADGLREFPLFFLLDLTDGETTFWGNFERFEYSNDQGTLVDELTGKNTTPWDPSMFVEPAQPQPVDSGSHPRAAVVEKDQLMKMFSEQLKRVEENHQAEMAEIEKKHAQELKATAASVTHDECVAEQKKIEAKLTGETQKLHERLTDVLKSNEGYKLKIDVLKREVAGMQQLLEHRDTDLGKASAVHKRDIKVLQEQLVEREEKASKAKQGAERAEVARKAAAEELEKTQREHAELKNRAKEVATELKERRAECSRLRHAVDELSEKNEKSEQSIENLTLQLSNHNINKSEKDGEMHRLRAELQNANSKFSELQADMQAKQAVAEKSLNDYKKKAQNSLAMANSRTASAVEAKEEAELEARAARSTADSAMDRAVKAEIASKEAVAEAKAYVAEMEKSTAKAKEERSKATSDMEIFRAKAAELQKAVDALTGEKNKLVTDLAHAQGRLEEEQGRSRALKNESERFKQQAQAAKDDVGKLRQQIHRLEASQSDLEESKEASRQTQMKEMKVDRDDATISMLQHQLAEANAVIEDLKSALNNAAEKHEAANSAESHANGGNGSRGAAPLFYAMEKQAELKTAQNEINRLANLLADVQSEKMEAVEAKEMMRQQMEDAQSKLERFQKLSDAPPSNDQKGLEPMPKNSGATNIEYLKNIMMRYLNAKTVAERKALVPVIAAVLCLTPEEQQGAIQTLEESASIKNVGNSLFESISGRYF